MGVTIILAKLLEVYERVSLCFCLLRVSPFAHSEKISQTVPVRFFLLDAS